MCLPPPKKGNNKDMEHLKNEIAKICESYNLSPEYSADRCVIKVTQIGTDITYSVEMVLSPNSNNKFDIYILDQKGRQYKHFISPEKARLKYFDYSISLALDG